MTGLLMSDIPQVVVTSPLSFALGVIVGLALSSRWLIVRREKKDR